MFKSIFSYRTLLSSAQVVIYLFLFFFFLMAFKWDAGSYITYISRRRRYLVRILLGSQTRGIDRDGERHGDGVPGIAFPIG